MSLTSEIQASFSKLRKIVKLVKDSSDGLLSTKRSGKDANDVWTIVEHFRDINIIQRRSTVSGGISPEYTTMTIEIFNYEGTQVVETHTYSLVYSGGTLIQRTLLSVS